MSGFLAETDAWAILALEAMNIRSAIKIGLLCGVPLGPSIGCQSSQPTAEDLALAHANQARASAVTVLPSTTQAMLGSLTGVPAQASLSGRRDQWLGSRYQPVPVVQRQSVDVRDDQRVINGRVQSNLSWRTRSLDRRR